MAVYKLMDLGAERNVPAGALLAKHLYSVSVWSEGADAQHTVDVFQFMCQADLPQPFRRWQDSTKADMWVARADEIKMAFWRQRFPVCRF